MTGTQSKPHGTVSPLGRFLPALALFFLLLTACDINISIGDDDSDAIRGSGNVITRDFSLSGFDALDVGSAFKVTVDQSDDFTVSITADDNLMELLEVETVGNALRIRLEPGVNVRSATLEAEISMPQLSSIDLSGASRLEYQGFDETTGPLEADISGASHLEGTIAGEVEVSGASHLEGTVAGGGLSLNLSGASRAELSGTADTLVLECSGASRAELKDLDVVLIESVKLRGASHATVTVFRAIDNVDLSGASHLDYHGDPTIGRVQTSGASTLRPR